MDGAISFVESMAVVPCNGGGVQLEIQHSSGIEVEIEFDADGNICGFFGAWTSPISAAVE